MSRIPPYDRHLCAENPAMFERGFKYASKWVPLARKYAPGRAEEMYRTVRDSTNVPFPQTAAKHYLDPTPWAEGFMLGVYGHVALERC
jgi:hypothetical protein